MSRIQILTALFLAYLACTCAEETGAQERIDDFLRPPPLKTIANEGSSYFSKLTSWLNPFGSDKEQKPVVRHVHLPPPPLIPLKNPKELSPVQSQGPPIIKSQGPPIIQSQGPPVIQSIEPPSIQQQETSHAAKYLPPQNGQQKDCNPCNKEPWLPVLGNYGSSTLIGFVQNSDLVKKGQLGGPYGAPNGNFQTQYGPPHHLSGNVPSIQHIGNHRPLLKPPVSEYGQPNHTPGNINPPPPDKHSLLPINYGPPPSENHGPLPNLNYGPPPAASNINFGPPANIELSGNDLPPKNYGPPPSSQYGPPINISPPKEYGPPSSSQHRPPKHISGSLTPIEPLKDYGPPPSPQLYNGPPLKPQYGPPNQIRGNLSPPSFSGNHGPPNINYGTSPDIPTIKYGPTIKQPSAKQIPFIPTPSTKYGQPSKYEPPNIPSYKPPPISPQKNRPSLPPLPSAFMGPPPFVRNKYGPPNIPPPISNYGPPPSVVPTNNYGPLAGNVKHLPPSFVPPSISAPLANYKPPQLNNQYSASSDFVLKPVSDSVVFAPTLPAEPAKNFVTPLSTRPQSNAPVVDSYGPPPSGPVVNTNRVKITSEEYLPPPQQLPISNGHDATTSTLNVPPISQQVSNYGNTFIDPIPFPNMSPTFILPVRNARPFTQNGFINKAPVNDNIPLQGSNIEVPSRNIRINNQGHQGSNVQISQSVPIAEFLSTIEYPANVVQSPIIDVIVANNNNAHEDNAANSQEQYKVNLSENPIVVDGDEHHQEASDNHAAVTVHNDTIAPPINFQTSNHNTLDILTENRPLPTEFRNITAEGNVQIEPSLQTLFSQDNSLASIITQQLLNSNNSPKPFEPAEITGIQKTEKQLNQNAQETNNAFFTPPSIDYSNWTPSVEKLPTSMVPPLPSQSNWISVQNFLPFTTKRPKQIQIIIPYTTNKNQNNLYQQDLQGRKVPVLSTLAPYNPSLSLFTKVPSAEGSEWLKYVDHNFQETKTKLDFTQPSISNIQDFFKGSNGHSHSDSTQQLPFDILKLQKNIDVWTEQEYNKMKSDTDKSSTTSRFAYSKKIPDEYFTTQSLGLIRNEATTTIPISRNSKLFHDYIASGTQQHSIETKPQNLTELPSADSNLLESNLIGSDTTTQNPEVSSRAPLSSSAALQSSGKPTVPPTWEKIQVSISPLTNERVYVVTPQPWDTDASTPQSAWSYVPKREIQHINKQLADNANFVFNSPRFAIRPEPVQMNKSKELDTNSKIHLVYSDWPELINNLATTTETPMTTTQHPLLGRMDILVATSPHAPERTDQTHTGHSKVVTAVTASTTFKKKTGIDDKSFTTQATAQKNSE